MLRRREGRANEETGVTVPRRYSQNISSGPNQPPAILANGMRLKPAVSFAKSGSVVRTDPPSVCHIVIRVNGLAEFAAWPNGFWELE